MARAKTKNTVPIWFKIAAILIVLGTVYFVFQNVNAEGNKRNFESARTAIDTIVADTKSKYGAPDNSERVNTCGKNNKILVCSISTKFIYGIDSNNSAQDIFKSIQGFIRNNNVLTPTQGLSTDLKSQYGSYDGTQDFYKTGSLVCTAKYLYDTPVATFLKLKDDSKKPFYVEIGCTGPAKKRFY